MSNTIVNILKYNMLNYGGYIITDRVLPAVEDGIKPSYRRILWCMEKQKATKFVKSGNIAGNVFKYHPHGSVYPTMVNMTQTDKQNIPYLTGRGNFGQHTSTLLKEGAERYTECKLSPIAIDMLEGVKKNMVEMINNYDDTEKMPKYLPVKYPSILCYASKGIALGMSSNIPSFNMVEVCESTKKYLKTGEKDILYPDFATGGTIIEDDSSMAEIIQSGKGSIRIRGNCEIDGDSIIIKEIPYTATREIIIDKIIEYVKSGKLKDINDVKDLTGLKGLKIEVVCKKGTNMESVLDNLYRMTQLESSFSCNMNVLVDGVPMVLGFYEIIDAWYNFRSGCIKKSLMNDVEKLEKELHLLEGLKKVLLDIDNAIKIIRTSSNPENEISKTFNVDMVQAKYICGIQLRNINNDHIIKQIDEMSNKENKLNKLKNNIENPEFIKDIVIKDLDDTVKSHGIPRKSSVEKIDVTTRINKEDNIESYNVKLQLTKEGYFKKVKLNAYKGENKLKDGDEIIAEFDATNKDEVVFFGDDLNAYKFKLYELEDNKLNSLGVYIKNLINVNVLGMTIVDDLNKFIVICYKDRIAKVSSDSFKTITNRRKLTKSLFSKDVQNIITFNEDKLLVIESTKGKVKEFNTKDIITKTTRSTQGIKVLGKDSILKSYKK
ncbi:DNA topoisomerase (ATP-hydrolyzing) subunit A [uncultured Clostridium sp.]|uniref:DNA gyrase/topoisomerase IV subunit A n=1 Tax=uncultured Clostridium sp. TaxID=59620 RepID=UPI0025E36EBA|nr:DNA topoisomerase (ATP-hydrolyzing) subunit A [uncultured Clostridium sp.]